MGSPLLLAPVNHTKETQTHFDRERESGEEELDEERGELLKELL